MSTEQNRERNKAIVRRFNDEVVSQYKIEVASELFHTDYIHHDPSLPPELQRGLANYTQVLHMFKGAFPDLTGVVEDLIAEGDKVFGRLTYQGTHQGELMGIPATGKAVAIKLMGIYRFADGKIAEGWVNFDAMGMMQQLGVIPRLGQQ